MSTDNLDSADLKAALEGGLIAEDIMRMIWDISKIPLECTESITSDTAKNAFTEYTQDKLQDVDEDNAKVDGSDTIGDQDTNLGTRVGSHCQISTKTVKVSTRARASDTIGRSDELAFQIMMRQQELKRDLEAISIGQQASAADDGNAQPGRAAGFASWLTSHTDRGVGGTDGGFAGGQTAAPGVGTTRALSEETIRDIAQSVWEAGGNPSRLMSTPTVIRKLSAYMFTNTAQIATLADDVRQSKTAASALGSVNLFITDFGVTLAMIPNRLQQEVAADNANVYIYDPEFVRHSFLHGFRVEPLQKSGLADNRQMIVDWTLKVLTEEAHGVIADIDPTTAVVA